MTVLASVAIGGVGGSGTRVGASLLRLLGYRIGGDLNMSLDNLWFTLLFKRRNILLQSPAAFDELFAIFCARMMSQPSFTEQQRRIVLALAADDRPEHDAQWLTERAGSFLHHRWNELSLSSWGWKEPNTHIVIDRLLKRLPALRYLHMMRHPLDMAVSENQNQQALWGPIFLNRDVTPGPRDSLRYWCAAHRRVTAIMECFPDRIMLVDYDRLCVAPEATAEQVAHFVGRPLIADVRTAFSALVGAGSPSRGRHRPRTLDAFDPSDLHYVETLGYSVDEGVGT